MSKKTFEMSFQIGGKLTSSFSNAFSGATNKLVGLKNQARQTQRALDQLSNDFRRGKIHESQYTESTQRLTSELAKLERAQKRINSFKSGVNKDISTVKSTASVAAFGTAATAAGVAMNSMNKAADFQKQMTKVGVIAGATQSEVKKLNDTALQLGASSPLSSSQVAVAMGELAAKGMNANKIIGAMPGILAAASASGEDLAMTSNVVTSALNAFDLKATSANHVADVMAMSANKSAAGVEDLGYSFKYAAPIAKTLGMSLEALAASTGIMVDKGLTGEQAGTSLRMALIRLAKPSRIAAKAMDKLNFSATDSHDKFKSLTQLTKDWNKSTKDLTKAQKVAYAADVFGTESATGMLDLFAAGPKKIDAMTKSLEKSDGAAKKAADAMNNNYAGALNQLKGSIEMAQIKFATPILPIFKDIFNGISSTLTNNLGGIEKAGQRVAKGLKDIFEPFTSKKEKFKSMDFGDKVVSVLDRATAKASQWLDGPGGKSMNKVFTKLGEIAAKAWYTAFTNTVKSSLSNLGQGNVFPALGLGAAAWMMGGGMIAKGAFGAGKTIYKTAKGGRKVKVPEAAKVVPTKGRGKVVEFPKTSKTPTMSKFPKIFKPLEKTAPVLSKGAKLLSKVAVPLSIASTVIDVATSKDKTKAAVSGVGGLAGSWGGAELGAAIGTAILPGVGTIVGGLAGGALGYAAGHWVGGKVVDKTRQAMTTSQPNSASSVPTNNRVLSNSTNPIANKYTVTDQLTGAASSQMPQMNSAVALSMHNLTTLASYTGQASAWIVGSFTGIKSSANRVKFNLDTLTSYTGQASGWTVGAFTGIKSSADRVKRNLDILVSYAGQASGWLASLSSIPSASKRVERALNGLANRIENVHVPSSVGGNKRVSYNN